MSALKEAWEALRAVIGMSDDIQRLWVEVRNLREENQELRERLVRLETIIEEARKEGGRRNKETSRKSLISKD